MEWLATESRIMDKLQVMLSHGGHPLHAGYVAGYVSLFLNAYKLGGPKGDHIFDVLQARGASEDKLAQVNLPALCEAWSHWWALLDECLRRQMLTLGPRGPYDDFVPRPGPGPSR